MRGAVLGLVAIAACFTGDSAQGLPCSADEFCAGLKCIDGFCGGAPDSVDPTGSSTSVTATTDSTSPTSTTEPTSTTTPTGTTEIDTTGTETTGSPQSCTLARGWNPDDFTLDDDDRFSSAGRPLEMVVARMDTDPLPDLVTANVNGGEYLLELRRGVAPGTFDDDPPLDRGLADNPDELIAGAIDEDTHADLVVAYSGSNQISIFLWNALDSTFDAVTDAPLATGNGPHRPVILDFDGSGGPDVAYATTSGVQIFSGITTDGPAPTVVSFGSALAEDLGVATYEDSVALVATHYAINEVALYRPLANRSDLLELRSASVPTAGHVVPVDLDQDGDSDVVVVGQDGRIWKVPSFLDRNDEDPVMIGSFAGIGAPERVVMGQLDGECGLDMAILVTTADANDNDVLLMRYEDEVLSDGIFLGMPASNAIQIADLEGDGPAELVVANEGMFVQIARYSP